MLKFGNSTSITIIRSTEINRTTGHRQRSFRSFIIYTRRRRGIHTGITFANTYVYGEYEQFYIGQAT